MKSSLFQKEILNRLATGTNLDNLKGNDLSDKQYSIVYSIDSLLRHHSTLHSNNSPYSHLGHMLDALATDIGWLLSENIPPILRAKLFDINGAYNHSWESLKQARILFEQIIRDETDVDILCFCAHRYVILSKMDKDLQKCEKMNTIRSACQKLLPVDNDLPRQLLELCYDQRALPDIEIARNCELHIQSAWDSHLYNVVFNYLDLAEKAYCRLPNGSSDEDIRRIQRKRVDYYKLMATPDDENLKNNYGSRRYYIEEAIHSLMHAKLPGYRNEVEALKMDHDALSKSMLASMPSFQQKIDFSEVVKTIEKDFSPLTLEQRICRFAYSPNFRLPSKAQIHEDVIKEQKNSFFLRLFPPAQIDRDGHTLYKLPVFDKGNEETVMAYMQRYAGKLYCHMANVAILPGLSFIQSKDGDIEGFIGKIVEDSDWIPPKRKSTWIKGLVAGFQGDFCAAANLLAPQLEAWIRYIVECCGHSAYSINDEGVQQAASLDIMLSEILKDTLNEDLLFTLDTVLISHYGCNLRNRIAHGLLDDDQYISDVVYLWWFALHICYLHAYTIQNENDKA